MQREFDPEEVARYEHATWSRCAQGYLDGFGPLTSEAIEALLNAVGVNEGIRILDIGTGPGLVAAAARERGAKPVGIDFSEGMLAVARQLHPEIEFRAGSADSLPFEDGEFDAVVGNFVLHHMGRPEMVLKEAFRVLRGNGRMGFTVWGDPVKLEAFGLFFASVEEHVGAVELPHGPLFGLTDFEFLHRMVRDTGFCDSSVRELDIAWRMGSLEPFFAAFRDWANMDTFPIDIRAAIENTVRDRATDYLSDDGFAIPNPAILVSAVKSLPYPV